MSQGDPRVSLKFETWWSQDTVRTRPICPQVWSVSSTWDLKCPTTHSYRTVGTLKECKKWFPPCKSVSWRARWTSQAAELLHNDPSRWHSYRVRQTGLEGGDQGILPFSAIPRWERQMPTNPSSDFQVHSPSTWLHFSIVYER